MDEQQPPKKLSTGAMVAVAVVLAIAIGSGAYAYSNHKATKEKVDLQAQITELQNQIDETVTETTTAIALTAKTAIATDETGDWRIYTNDEYGFSFKYPASWTEYSPGGNAGDDFSVFFKNPEIKATTEGENADPYAIQNIFVRVYGKNSTEKLSDWLNAKFRGMGGELSDYNVGEQIQMGEVNGYLSNIGCCGSFDKSYVVEKNGFVIGLGTFSSEKYTMLAEIAKTFQFTK